ncbi:matrixin family metalloprotease [Aeromicrobium sp. CF4.19]|uniref:matrixin family metalloprotease n=1 Tax=Aeromicrobium sp. CF4.19 TaxID=3373082 RepID=UPI003EE43751
MLDGPQLASLDSERSRAVLLHELAHLVGLDHVDDTDELMYPTSGPLEWGPGDLAGLEALGEGRCA